jgi:RecA/RadA recombinase
MRDQAKPPKRLTAEAVHAITNALRDFGYKAVTDNRVRELGDGLLDGSISYPFRTGETPKGGTITRFIAGQLSDAGWLPADE